MKLDSLLSSNVNTVYHSNFDFKSEEQNQNGTNSSSSNSSSNKRVWEPTGPSRSSVNGLSSLGSSDPFLPNRSYASTSTASYHNNPPQRRDNQNQQQLDQQSRNLPSISSWNQANRNWDPYTRPIQQPIIQHYTPTFYSLREITSNLSSNLAEVRSYPELISPNGDRVQIITHEQIHSTLIALYNSNPSAQESSRKLTVTYNIYVETSSFLSFLPHPITPFKLLALTLLLHQSSFGREFRKTALASTSESKIKKFQLRTRMNTDEILNEINEVIEVCGMLSGWWEPSNWESREQWKIWERELKDERYLYPSNTPSAPQYNSQTYPNSNREQNAYSTANTQRNSNLSASRPRASISLDPQGFTTARPLLNSRPSISQASPIRETSFYPRSPEPSSYLQARPRSKRPSPSIRSNKPKNSSTTQISQQPAYIPEVQGYLPGFRRPPILPPILPSEEFLRVLPTWNLENINRNIAKDRPKRLGVLEMISWSADEDEDGDGDGSNRRLRKRVRRAVSRDGSDGSESST